MIAPARRGVTLIETLIVLALIAMMASVAVLSAPAQRSGAREEAERFAAKLDSAMTLALSSGAPVRVDLTASGYAFYAYRDQAWTEATTPGSLRRRAVRPNVVVSIVSPDAKAAQDKDQQVHKLLLDPLGAGGPTSVAFADARSRWLVLVDGATAPKVARDGG